MEGVMKSTQRFAVLGVLLAWSGLAVAGSASLNEFRSKVIPVLVRVNSHGKVTRASPAMTLSPGIQRLLRANLDEMIQTPATDKRGRPITSQFIINLAVQASPQDNGNYEAQFTYISTEPVPAGSWHWVHIDGHRLALGSQRYPDPLLTLRPEPYHQFNPHHESPMSAACHAEHNMAARPPAAQDR